MTLNAHVQQEKNAYAVANAPRGTNSRWDRNFIL